jgi:UrcA family protein
VNKFLSLLVAMGSLAGCTGLPALARAGDEAPRSVIVSARDLDLSKPQGLATLHRRLENAARTVCEPLDGTPLVQQMLYRRCVAQALGAAVAKHPMLARETVAR